MKLSIITVNFNNKDGLQKTIDSVISQTFKDFEWIVIDGGSTDGSKELIEKYSDYISYWVSEPDKGVYNAMNKGIKVAKGEYLNFLNSGDVYYNTEALHNIFSKHIDCDIIFGNTLINKNGKLKRINIQNDYITCYHLTKDTINHQCSFIKKELFDMYGLYDESLKIVSDWKFFFETIVLKKCTLEHVNQDIILYDTNGLSSINRKQEKEEKEKILRTYLPEYVFDDYKTRFEVNELLNHRLSRVVIGILYRIITKLERLKLIQK